MLASNQASSPETVQQFISFALTTEIQAMLPTQQLAESLNLDLANIISIPDLPPAVVGVCFWRGEVLWLIDLAYLFGFTPLLNPEYRQPKCSILRVTTPLGSVGFLVTEVRQLIRASSSQIQSEIPSLIPATKTSLLQGSVLNPQGERVLLLDVGAIVESLNQ